MLKKIIFLGFFTFSLSVFSKEINKIYDENNVIKYKGINVLNFYIPVEEKNKFSSYIDSEMRDNINIFQWTIAEGYLEINNLWDFEYNMEKEFYFLKNGVEDRYNGWDNKIIFVRSLKDTYILKKDWKNEFITGLEQNQLNNTEFEVERYKIFLGYRTRTSFENIGMGGTYFGFDFIGKRILSKDGDGISGEIDIISSTNLGYGFQFFNIIYNEYLSYENYSSAFRLGIENYLKWTYELNWNWAFSVEIGMDNDKYFGNTENNYNTEIYIYPHFLFDYNLTSEFRVIGEIGLPSYKMIEDNTKYYKNSEKQKYYYFKVGIEYIF